MIGSRTLRVGVLVAAGFTAVCMPDDQRTDSVDVDRIRREHEAQPAAGIAQMDSGNASYRVRDYARALEHFRSATEIMPENTAAWFGVAMAAQASGRIEVADSAMNQARQLAPGASLIHPSGVQPPEVQPPDSAGGAP